MKEADNFLHDTVKGASKSLISKLEKEIDSETVKANLSPKTSSTILDKNTAKVRIF